MATAKGSVRIEGLTRTVRALEKAGVEVDDLKSAFSRIANDAARIASQEAPKKSGRLSGDVRGNRAKSKAVVRAGRASVPYAGPINYGWKKRNIKPNPFMQRADKRIEPRVIPMLEADINRITKSLGLR